MLIYDKSVVLLNNMSSLTMCWEIIIKDLALVNYSANIVSLLKCRFALEVTVEDTLDTKNHINFASV